MKRLYLFAVLFLMCPVLHAEEIKKSVVIKSFTGETINYFQETIKANVGDVIFIRLEEANSPFFWKSLNENVRMRGLETEPQPKNGPPIVGKSQHRLFAYTVKKNESSLWFVLSRMGGKPVSFYQLIIEIN